MSGVILGAASGGRHLLAQTKDVARITRSPTGSSSRIDLSVSGCASSQSGTACGGWWLTGARRCARLRHPAIGSCGRILPRMGAKRHIIQVFPMVSVRSTAIVGLGASHSEERAN